jgi:hypothetical protein
MTVNREVTPRTKVLPAFRELDIPNLELPSSGPRFRRDQPFSRLGQSNAASRIAA